MRVRKSRSPAWSAQELAILDDVYARKGIDGACDALPDRSRGAICLMASKRQVRAPAQGPVRQLVLTGAKLEEAVRRRQDDKWSFARIAREFDVTETSATNAVLIALCPRMGFRPAARDATGRLLPEGLERVRYALKKGLKGVDIQLRLGISAACVAEQRRRYARDLAARDKAPLPPPGGGEQYSGVPIPRAAKRLAEATFLEGYGAPTVAAKAGISVPSAKRLRRQLVDRLSRKGQVLPGCDLQGRRLGPAKTSVHFIPPAAIEQLREKILAREPIARSARELGIGSCSAYRIRDELAAELAARGEQLLPPIRLGRGAAYRAVAAEADWLPAGQLQRFRTLTYQHRADEAKRLMLEKIAAIDAAAEAAAAQAEAEHRAWRDTFEGKLARIAAGAGLVDKLQLRRPPPAMTLGGVASGAL